MIFLRRYKKYTSIALYVNNSNIKIKNPSYVYFIIINTIDISSFNGCGKFYYGIETPCAKYSNLKNYYATYIFRKSGEPVMSVKEESVTGVDFTRRIINEINNKEIVIRYFSSSDTIEIDRLSPEQSIMQPNTECHKALIKTRSLMKVL